VYIPPYGSVLRNPPCNKWRFLLTIDHWSTATTPLTTFHVLPEILGPKIAWQARGAQEGRAFSQKEIHTNNR